MPKTFSHFVMVCLLIGLAVVFSSSVNANWFETFDGNTFDLSTWQFSCYPDYTKTFNGTIRDGLDENDYISLDETSPAAAGGSQFGVGIGDTGDIFRDVRVGAEFNIAGDASWNYHGLAARMTWFIDDGSITEYPGIVASCYVLIIHYEEGPANLKVELIKAVNLQTDIMATWQPEVPVPGLDHAKTHYYELDVVGSGPVYITGSVYEYKGGPLLVRTPTFVDTNGNDPWEAPSIHDAVFTEGASGIFGMWEDPQPSGYHSSFDSVSSVSDGPAAVNPNPPDGATDVSIDTTLSWIEADFAAGRELWLGTDGQMAEVEPDPSAGDYSPANLKIGRKYQWRVDQVGASGAVTGHTWTFETAPYVTVDDFQSYANEAELRNAWPHSIPGNFQYVFLSTDNQGNKSIRLEVENQYEPFVTEFTRTFENPQDWTAQPVEELSLSFVGEHENAEQPMYIRLEDTTGQSFTVDNPYPHASQSDSWRWWTIALSRFVDGGVNLTSVKKITIGLGDTTDSGQGDGDRDHIFIDRIELSPAGLHDIQ